QVGAVRCRDTTTGQKQQGCAAAWLKRAQNWRAEKRVYVEDGNEGEEGEKKEREEKVGKRKEGGIGRKKGGKRKRR
ncbi:hypothetical protein, partial [Escherichia coli]|uniref:hypothetical protein n=1 Tax=Escherichia coli TaxID=562 RepID=UPI001BDB9EA9